MASDIKIQILQSGTTTTITPDNNILTSGELAYTYANGDSAGGDRLFIGAGGNDSANGFATEIHTIGGKYYTDMMDHPKGQVHSSSAIITDADNKIDQLNVDNISINGSTITSNAELNIQAGNNFIDVGLGRIRNLTDPTDAQHAATKNYVDTIKTLYANGDVNVSGLGDIVTGESLLIAGGVNTNTTREDVSGGVKVTVNLDDQVLGLSRLTVDNFDIAGNDLQIVDGDMNLIVPGGNSVIVTGNLQVNGTTTTINSTELTVDDKNITLASGAENAASADSAGIHVDGANADIFYDAATNTWNFNKDLKAPNIDINGNITVSGDITISEGGSITGGYAGFDSDFGTKSTSDLSEGTNLYYTTTRFDSSFGNKTTDDLTEGSTNLYFADALARAAVNASQTGGDGAFTYDLPSGIFTYVGPDETNYRAAFSATGDLSYNQSTGVFSIDVETEYTKANFDSDLGDATTDDLPEGTTNLYYTDGRFDSALGTKTTDDVTEGSNLYYTDERVDDRIATTISVSTGLSTSYDDLSNNFEISLSQASSTQLGGAKFDSVDFLVTAGNVEIATIDCGTY